MLVIIILQHALDCAVDCHLGSLLAWEKKIAAIGFHLEVVEYDAHALLANLGDGHAATHIVVARCLCLHFAAIEQVEILACSQVLILEILDAVGVEVEVEGLAVGINLIRRIGSNDCDSVVVRIALGILLGVVGEGNLRVVDLPCAVVYRQLIDNRCWQVYIAARVGLVFGADT